MVWNTWSAVAPAVEAAFPDWPAGTVAVTANWGVIQSTIETSRKVSNIFL